MSRINVENIRHPDAASDSLQLSNTGNITAPGNLSVTGTSTLTNDLVVDTDTLFVDVSTDRVGIGITSPDTSLHVHAASAGAVTANGAAQLVVENNADSGINILSPNTAEGWLMFGDPDDNFVGGLSYDHTNDLLSVYANNSERLTITSNGTLQLRNSPGIDFSQIQTNAAGMTSETLDSYEEGSWTPTFTGTSSNPTITYTQQIGNYTKIGNLVYVSCLITISAVSGGGGNLMVSGLPFTIGESTGTGGAPSFTSFDTPGTGSVSCATELNTSQTRFFAGLFSFDNAVWVNVTVSGLTSSTSYRVAFSYRV